MMTWGGCWGQQEASRVMPFVCIGHHTEPCNSLYISSYTLVKTKENKILFPNKYWLEGFLKNLNAIVDSLGRRNCCFFLSGLGFSNVPHCTGIVVETKGIRPHSPFPAQTGESFIEASLDLWFPISCILVLNQR